MGSEGIDVCRRRRSMVLGFRGRKSTKMEGWI